MNNNTPYIHHEEKLRPFDFAINAGIKPRNEAVINISITLPPIVQDSTFTIYTPTSLYPLFSL